MSWRLAFHSTKLLFSYLIPYKVKIFRDAIFSGNIAVIRQLAAERPRLLQQSIDADGNTAIGLSLMLGEVDVVKTLLELGSDPNLANSFDGNHPLVILAKLRSDENSKLALFADLLLDAGSDPLHEVQYQADSAKRLDATQTPSFHETPLLCCVRFQNEELLKKFIEHQIDVNALNPETGTSALMLAASLGYRNICNILIEAGADANAKDHSGNSPLHLAAQGYGEQIPVVELLLQHGADVNSINDDGFTPAVLARKMEKDACFRLLESYADKNPPRAVPPPPYEHADEIESDEKQPVPFSFH
ncbi:unnamed protein product [Adineta ricciae]|uniref:Uncharacterized protein n=1 Tax=Adineta ricciae TaxID=249248 RepID=A0A815F104_ADIRI|nr:unnamed protein product [Adineta ricciae]